MNKKQTPTLEQKELFYLPLPSSPCQPVWIDGYVYNIQEMCEQLDMTNLDPKQDLIFVHLCLLRFFGSQFVRGTVRREVRATR